MQIETASLNHQNTYSRTTAQKFKKFTTEEEKDILDNFDPFFIYLISHRHYVNNTRQMAIKYGVSVGAINHVLRRAGIEARPVEDTEHVRKGEVIHAYVVERRDKDTIAESFGMTANEVMQIIETNRVRSLGADWREKAKQIRISLGTQDHTRASRKQRQQQQQQHKDGIKIEFMAPVEWSEAYINGK